MQRTLVWSLDQGNSLSLRTTKPLQHNYWAHSLETISCKYGAHVPRACAPQQEKTPQWETHAPQWKVTPFTSTRERPCKSNEDPAHSPRPPPAKKIRFHLFKANSKGLLSSNHLFYKCGTWYRRLDRDLDGRNGASELLVLHLVQRNKVGKNNKSVNLIVILKSRT